MVVRLLRREEEGGGEEKRETHLVVVAHHRPLDLTGIHPGDEILHGSSDEVGRIGDGLRPNSDVTLLDVLDGLSREKEGEVKVSSTRSIESSDGKDSLSPGGLDLLQP